MIWKFVRHEFSIAFRGNVSFSLIAQAFDSIRYPILPVVTSTDASTELCPDCVEEILHVRHYSLYVPRDFDVSPYFQVVKPTVEIGFDFHHLRWDEA
jgi:hypothetical protein